MSQALNATRALVEAYNNADWSRLADLLASDCLYDEVATGREALMQQLGVLQTPAAA